MKKFMISLCLLAGICMFTGCKRGNTANVKIIAVDSDIYTEKDISDAVQTVREYFEKNYKTCTLTELYYIGDEENPGYQEFAERIGADEVIVFLSEFDVSESHEGSLNPGETYTGYNWILGRKKGGSWEHIDHGY